LIVIGNLPSCPIPNAKKDPAACSQRGGKWESSGNTGRKQGRAVLSHRWRTLWARESVASSMPRMPARRINGMSLPAGGLVGAIPPGEIVITIS
jgi:hypothetical protein